MRRLILPALTVSLALVISACGDDGAMNSGPGSDAGDMSGDMMNNGQWHVFRVLPRAAR